MDPIATALESFGPSIYSSALVSGGSVPTTSASALPALDQILLSGASQPGAPLTYGSGAIAGAALTPADDLSLATANLDAQTSAALLGGTPVTSDPFASPASPSDPSASLLGISGSLDALNALGASAVGYIGSTTPAPGSLFSGLA